MNKNTYVDPAFIEMAKQQCYQNIQNNLNQIALFERYQTSMNPPPQQTCQLPMAAMMGIGCDTPKGSPIYTPKPLAINRIDSRVGRSHSMFVTTELQSNQLLEDDKQPSEGNKISEELSDNSGGKDLSDKDNSRKRMNVFRCPHTDRKHYAKNMCNNCYHKLGRNKKATKCPHGDRQNYAKGKCQNCYLNDYHKVKRKMKKRQQSSLSLVNEEDVDRRISVETSSTEQVQDGQARPTAIAQN